MIRKPGSQGLYPAHATKIMEDLKEEEASEDNIKLDDNGKVVIENERKDDGEKDKEFNKDLAET